VVVPVLVAALAYANTLGNFFVLDDYHFVIENPAVVNGVSLPLFHGNLTSSGTEFYRPLGIFLYSIEYNLLGGSAFVFHLTSLLAHVGVTLLVVLVVLRLASWRVAMIAGLLFAVHPVHVEAVASVANRTELLASILYLSALLVHLRAAEREAAGQGAPWWRAALATSSLALLAMLCKESAITLPLTILAVDWLRPGGSFRLRGALSVVPGIAAYFVLRRIAGIDSLVYYDYFYNQSLGVRVLTTGTVVTRYVELLVAPTRLLADYSDPTIPLAHGLGLSVAFGFAVVAGIVAAIVVGVRHKNLASLGLAFLGIGMAPYLHVLPVTVIMAERFLYLPSFGFCLAAAVVIARVWERLDPRWVGAALVAALTLTLGALTISRNADWHDPITLWKAEVASDGRSAYSHAQLGLSLYNFGGDRAEAVHHLELAVARAPARPEFRLALAKIHAREGRLDAARRILRVGPRTKETVELLRLIERKLRGGPPG
jgi:hypothetical protein